MPSSTPERTAAHDPAAHDAAAHDAAARFAVLAAEVQALAAEALAGDRTAGISDETLQLLLTAGIRLFAAKTEFERRYFSPLTSTSAVTATDAAVLVTELLRAVDLNLFDLSMWASRPRD